MMERVIYGNTGLEVSRLCIGCGHFTRTYPTLEDAARFLLRVLEKGVNFWDTAEMYGTHPHIGAALKRIQRSEVVIQTKLGHRDYDTTKERLDKALKELNTDYVDVLLLHGVNSPDDLEQRAGALQAMLEAQAAGKVRHVGCSTHVYTGPVMDAVTARAEIEVILCTLNKTGMMLEGSVISDGTREPQTPSLEAHIAQIQRAFAAGKGISIMKIIAGGQVPENEREDYITWAFEFPYAHAVNLG
ncbi:MAG: aldo/keto reductase, partial [Abditibacteriales bacterium]|nr:aldo/keto reductase [Abditibacteriales bacterium]MDW8368299.1 aldo/keto reductase [Abditibacteriales bacterium]